MRDKLCVVTGATDGIGKEVARGLLQQGATVLVHGRNSAKLEQVVAELNGHGDGVVYPLRADFASLDEVSRMAAEIREHSGRVDVLVNNAGLLTDHRQLSRDGFELCFAVNYLAPFLLTHLLLDTLVTSAPARVVNVASTAMGGGVIDPDNLQLEHRFDGWQAYANSKLANVMFSHLLAEQLAGTGVVSNALCPGLIDTNFFHTNTVFSQEAYERMRPGMRSPEEGAAVPLYLATAEALASVSGKFFLRPPQFMQAGGLRQYDAPWDRAAAMQLWETSLSYLAPWLDGCLVSR